MPARRVAAGLERGHPEVDHVTQKRNGRVTVWLTDDVDEAVSLDAPDGWYISGAFVSSPGNHGLRLRRE